MPRFFVPAPSIAGGAVRLTGRDAEHIRVLRIRPDEEFTVCDGAGTDYVCRLARRDGDETAAEIIRETPSTGEPDVSVTVFLAFAKGDRLDYAVQKCVELGAAAVTLFPSERAVAKPDAQSLPKKLARWQSVARSAAEQSGRGRVPEIFTSPSFEQAMEDAAKYDAPLFFYEEARGRGLLAALAGAPPKTVSIVTGAEGGFTPEEASLAAEKGLKTVTLGPRILRCDTAPIAALAGVMLITNNL
jgi:16S rRNA (uracil1498-N3)-methyltransferase